MADDHNTAGGASPTNRSACSRPQRQRVLLIESRAAFARQRFHRRKAHLVLSALRHRAAELGNQALLQTRTYREAWYRVRDDITVCWPTSWAADRFVRAQPPVTALADTRMTASEHAGISTAEPVSPFQGSGFKRMPSS